MFAFCNTESKKKFFVPFHYATFGGFPVSTLMMDSGCNTTLLAPAKGDVERLKAHFPLTSFTWRLQIGGLAGSLGSPVLLIENILKAPFDCAIPTVNFHFPMSYLRFHVCTEDLRIFSSWRRTLRQIWILLGSWAFATLSRKWILLSDLDGNTVF